MSNSDWHIFFILQNPHTPVCCISVFSPFCVCLAWPHGNCFTCDDSSLLRSSLSSPGNLMRNHYKLDYHASFFRCFVTFLTILLALMNLSMGLGYAAPSCSVCVSNKLQQHVTLLIWLDFSTTTSIIDAKILGTLQNSIGCIVIVGNFCIQTGRT